MKGIIPTLNQYYVMIAEDEIQKLACASITNNKVDHVAMQVKRSLDINYRSQNYKRKKYDYCHFTGHTRENCYKLIGYPGDWRQKRKIKYNNGSSKWFMYHNQEPGKLNSYGPSLQAKLSLSFYLITFMGSLLVEMLPLPVMKEVKRRLII